MAAQMNVDIQENSNTVPPTAPVNDGGGISGDVVMIAAHGDGAFKQYDTTQHKDQRSSKHGRHSNVCIDIFTTPFSRTLFSKSVKDHFSVYFLCFIEKIFVFCTLCLITHDI